MLQRQHGVGHKPVGPFARHSRRPPAGHRLVAFGELDVPGRHNFGVRLAAVDRLVIGRFGHGEQLGAGANVGLPLPLVLTAELAGFGHFAIMGLLDVGDAAAAAGAAAAGGVAAAAAAATGVRMANRPATTLSSSSFSSFLRAGFAAGGEIGAQSDQADAFVGILGTDQTAGKQSRPHACRNLHSSKSPCGNAALAAGIPALIAAVGWVKETALAAAESPEADTC
jgi:hypothetical protein